MNIMIAGAGTVGYHLAKSLSFKHDIIIVDRDIKKLQKIEEDLDILTFYGDIEDPSTYNSCEIKNLDLFIAVTDSDEANLLSTLIIEDHMTIKKKIIRLKNDYFIDSPILEKLKVDDVVFPDLLTANKIKALLDFPKANNVKKFSQFKEKLVSIKVHFQEDKSYKIKKLTTNTLAIVGVERKREFFIPSIEDEIVEGDLIYLFGDDNSIKDISQKLDFKMPKSIKKIVIFGANILAIKVANSLYERGVEIKIIEKNRDLCNFASEILQNKATIINASYTEHDLFESERLKDADMIIATNKDDENNIVKCIEARSYNIEKVVVINNEQAYYALMHQLGLVVVRGAKVGAYYAILEKISSSSIIHAYQYCGGRGVMFLRKIYKNSPLIGKEIKSFKQKDTLLYQLRDNKLYDCNNFITLQEDDVIVVFGKIDNEDEIQKWIDTI